MIEHDSEEEAVAGSVSNGYGSAYIRRLRNNKQQQRREDQEYCKPANSADQAQLRPQKQQRDNDHQTHTLKRSYLAANPHASALGEQVYLRDVGCPIHRAFAMSGLHSAEGRSEARRAKRLNIAVAFAVVCSFHPAKILSSPQTH